jgi:hypothetical protein
MTRRERLERKLEKRADWAEGAREKSDAAFATAAKRAEAIPFGQPVLVGHHSEKRDRNYRARIHAGMDRGVAELRKAEGHESKARGLAAALDRSIYSDDPDAPDRLREKIEQLEASRRTMREANAAFRRSGREGVVALLGEARTAEVFRRASYTADKVPFPRYALANTGAEIGRAKKRLVQIEAERLRAGRAWEAGGIVIDRTATYCRVTFADKPDRAMLTALRDAGYRWGAGSWQGPLGKLPHCVIELERETAESMQANAHCPACGAERLLSGLCGARCEASEASP